MDWEKREVIPVEDVYIDEKGRGWHKVTQYQMDMLKKLWTALKPCLRAWPATAVVQANGDYTKNGVGHFATAASPALIGHVSLNPLNKSDPGPQVMKEINTWA
jgi:hypothetical protein